MNLLFQGDSITDCDRDRSEARPNVSSGLGNGYVAAVASSLASPGLSIWNRGICGNRVVDLYARWKPDALALTPDILSILVGVNDTWAEHKRRDGVEVPRYAAIYRMLLEWTREVRPDVRLVLCEPFVLPCGAVQPGWRREIDQRREIVARLASDFGATLVPFQTMFDAALAEHPADFWAADGVHPTPAGHERMARCWLESTQIHS